jgi:protoporphyrin/coproporphyrin ferrochelatase
MNKKGVLLVNLGSPDSPAVGDVRKYLREFLMDERVLDAPYPVRFGIVHFAILPTRPKQSAEAYAKIWSPEGSPLVATSRKVQAELQRRVPVPVELAMRYRNPSIKSGLTRLREAGVEELLLIPLFPHYAMSSYETAVERVKELLARVAPRMSLQVVPPYYDAPDYIAALAASTAEYLQQGYDHLLFSFHGLPERHLRKTDPSCAHCLRVERCCEMPHAAHERCYRAQCFRTVEAFARKAGVVRYSVAFQSRLGREPWLQPYTDQEIARLARDGIKKLLVICPAFVSDCLETLEEIGIRGREIFQEAGGRELVLIPCLNEHPRWLDALQRMITDFTETSRPVEAQLMSPEKVRA